MKLHKYIIIIFSIAILLAGCSQEKEKELELENQELKAIIKELEVIVDETSTEIERFEKIYELRNVLDIKSRQVITALNAGVFSENKEDLLGDNIVIAEDRLLISFENYENEFFFFQNPIDFEKLRQRFFHLDEQGRFITGYEVMIISDDIEKQINSRSVLVFTFTESSSGWKLSNIGTDR